MTLDSRKTLRPIAGTLGSRLAGLAIGVPVSILVARAMGPAGKGVFATAVTIAGIGAQIGSLGLPSANTYYVSRDRSLLGRLSTNSLVFGTLVGTTVGLLFGALYWFGGLLGDLNGVVLLLTLVMIPVGIGRLLQQSLLAGVQKYAVINTADVGAQVITLAVFLVLWLSGASDPVAYLAGSLAVMSVMWAVLTRSVRLQSSETHGPSLSLLLEQIPYGLRAYLATLFGYLVLRSDIVLVQAMAGDAETGLYSVAVSLADLLYVLPTAVGLVLFPQLAEIAERGKRLRATRTVVFYTGCVTAVLVAIALVVGQPVIILLFGREFAAAYPMFRILGPAILLYGLNTLLSIYLAAEGFPAFAVALWGGAFVLNLVLNLLLIPSSGAVGAATASLIAYAAVFVAHLLYIVTGHRRDER